MGHVNSAWTHSVNAERSRNTSQYTANDRFAAQGSMAGHGSIVCVRNEARKLSFASKVSHFQRSLSANMGNRGYRPSPAIHTHEYSRRK